MGEIRIIGSEDEELKLDYEVYVEDIDIAGHVDDTEVKFTEERIGGLEDDNIGIEFDENISKGDKMDYLLAAICGMHSGLLSVLWSKKFSLEEAHKKGKKSADNMVMMLARSIGYEGDNLAIAIEKLEKRFSLASDSVTGKFGGGLQHHLRDFSHHPTPLGLLVSILMQFTGITIGTNTEGKIITAEITNEDAIGKTFTDKIVMGTVNWVCHLISDMDGSSGTVKEGKEGTGILGPILSMIKEISALPIFKQIDENSKNNPKVISVYISKLFNGTLEINGEKVRFDMRTEMGIGHYITTQAKPVVINECLTRTCFMFSRFIDEVKSKNIESVDDLDKLEPSNFLPYNNRALTRMITVSSGVFVAVNASGVAVKSLIHSRGKRNDFCKEFFLTINYGGIVRLAIACKSDAEYIKDDLKEAYKKYIQDKEDLKENQFTFGYQFLSLTSEQTQVLFSLKALFVEADIENTKNPKHKLVKEEWLKRWKKATLESFGLEDEDFFMDKAATYEEINKAELKAPDKPWMSLVALELSLFEPYYSLDEDDKKLFSGLYYKDDYLYQEFTKEQKFVSKKELDSIVKKYRGYTAKLKASGKRAAVAVAATATVSVATGGLALAFAPEIAVVLSGGAAAGLSGAALTSASLASVGGGALAAGGLGMAGGTAILTGGGALIGLAGSGSVSLLATLSELSEKYTLNECAKLLTFCKTVVIDKYHSFEMMNPVIAGVEQCIKQLEEELEPIDLNPKKAKATVKKIKASLKYLNRCLEQLDILILPEKKKFMLGKK